jgi:hypothetical protein
LLEAVVVEQEFQVIIMAVVEQVDLEKIKVR